MTVLLGMREEDARMTKMVGSNRYLLEISRECSINSQQIIIQLGKII